MADNLRGIPISSLPKADELVADDQLIAYREDNGKAYRANVGTLGEAAESNLSDAFSTSKTYSAGEYVIYNDTLWKFTADKDVGEWDESVVEKTTMGTEIGEINSALAVSTGTPEMQGNYTSDNKYLVKYGKVVACYFQVLADSTSSSGDTVAYLPNGFRPSANIYCPIANATSTSGACYGRIFATGEVRLYYNTSSSSSTINCFICCTFITS